MTLRWTTEGENPLLLDPKNFDTDLTRPPTHRRRHPTLSTADLPAGLLDGLQDGDLDMGKLEEWQLEIENAAKNCDSDKLASLADACGRSVESQLKSCTDECKAMFAFMDEETGCGQLYANMGMQNIEGLCNGGTISVTPTVPATTTTDVPAPTTTTNDVPAPTVATPIVTVSGAGASSAALMAAAAALVILA